MAIENVMIETGQAELFAVCCTENLSVKALNLFFAAVRKQEEEESSPPLLALVHDLEAGIWGATRALRGSETVLQSPFKSCNMLQIQYLLQQMRQITGSLLDTEWFLVLDDHSEFISTAVIVNVEQRNVHSVRVAASVASRYLSAASVGHPPIDELTEIAAENGGVLDD